ncbi:hypothetical protein L1049_022055 [Liquidambar formosana]|uniref:Uncharacterized protein n=1 Tax=Liquidambar formosana TaxID=63359 RepID=A0AAP0RBY9_LIQFO
MSGSFPVFVCAFYAFCIFSFLDIAQAQAAAATTTPSEVAVLNSIFQEWGISAPNEGWNISGDPCSGTAIDSTDFDDTNYNPFIKCDCSYNNGSTCHITKLKVFALDAVGVIPEEFWNLTFLSNLDLRQNYLTGPLSPSIGNLTRLEYLTLGVNALSGELPKELGKLINLRSLSFATNNFSGSLPSELGSLLKLEQLYFDDSGVSGEIPSTFANLRNLVKVWGRDTPLMGRIPDFIGNWSKLTVLDLSYNELSGSFPSWVSQQNLQLNLVANNFTFDRSNSSVLPGLNCLQRNFPCNRGSGVYGCILTPMTPPRSTPVPTMASWSTPVPVTSSTRLKSLFISPLGFREAAAAFFHALKRVKIIIGEEVKQQQPTTNWLFAMNDHFVWYDVTDDQKVQIEKMKVDSHAKMWWKSMEDYLS